MAEAGGKNIIEEMAVRLTADGAPLLEAIDTALGKGEQALEDFGERTHDSIGDYFEDLTEEARRAGAQIVADMQQLGLSLQDALEEAKLLFPDISESELIQAAETVASRIDEIAEMEVAAIQKMAQSLGMVLTEEELTRFDEAVRQASLLNAAAEDMSIGMDAARATFLASALDAHLVADAMEYVNKQMEEAGKVLPIDEYDKLKKRMEKIVETGRKLGRSTDEIRANLKQVGQETIKAKDETSVFQKILGGLTTKILGAVSAYKAIQAGIKYFRESIEIAKEAIQTQVQLVLAVREHQRAVGELSPTVAEANQQSQYLAETYNLEINNTRRLVAESLLLTRQLKLSADETNELNESAVLLAELFGEEPLSVLQKFTNFLNTGYTQGLQSLGFQLDDQQLRVEAIRRGYIDLGDELDKHTLRMVGLELINERAAEVQDDVIQSQQTYIEQLDEVNQRLDRSQEILGKFLIPLWVTVRKTVTNALNSITQLLVIVLEKFVRFIGAISARLEALSDTVQFIQQEGFGALAERGGFAATFRENLAVRAREWERTTTKALQDILAGGFKLGDELPENLGKAADGVEDFSDRVVAAADEAAKSFDKLIEKYDEQVTRAEQNLAESLLRIEEQFNERRERMRLDLIHDIEDIERNAAERRLEVTRDYHLTEERELEDHRIKMQRLERDFLVDLEDAVRERDARAVLDLRRRYKRERQEAEDDFKLRQKRRKEDFDLELVEIERQKQVRTALRIEEFNEEIRQLNEQENLRQAQARRDFENRIRLLKDNLEHQLELEAKKHAASLQLEAEHTEALRKMLEAKYGPGGLVDAYMRAYLSTINQALTTQPATMEEAIRMGLGVPPSTQTTSTSPGDRFIGQHLPEGFQRGGTLFATSPTLVRVGETPERIDVTRLSASTGRPREGSPMGDKMEILLKVLADEGLKIDVADFTMSEIADVIVEINRQNQPIMRS
jgi:hypothetical protein